MNVSRLLTVSTCVLGFATAAQANPYVSVEAGVVFAPPSGVAISIDSDGVEITATTAPPAPRYEYVPAAPAPGYVWTPGYWFWTGASWMWVEGAWAAPPSPTYVYVSPRWVRRGVHWHFVHGGWADRHTHQVHVPVYRHRHHRYGWHPPQRPPVRHQAHAHRRPHQVERHEARRHRNDDRPRHGRRH